MAKISKTQVKRPVAAASGKNKVDKPSTKPASTKAGTAKASSVKTGTTKPASGSITSTKAGITKSAAGNTASTKSGTAKSAAGNTASTKAGTAKPAAGNTASMKAGTANPATGKSNATVAPGKSNNKQSPKSFAGKKVSGAKSDSAEADEKFVQSLAADIDAMMKGLCDLYPDAHCELDFNSTFQLLTSVILSAQTTDVGVNKCTPTLFKRFPDAKALAEADIEEIKQIIKPTGFFNAKAQNIQRCAQALVARFGGEVPKNLEDLTSLPGVGRKTANVVLGVAFGEPGWTVDTHVQRLVRRMGFTPETDPVKIEFALQKVFPNQDWSQYSITIIWHGRRLCFARNPNCGACPINRLCPSSQV